MTSLKYLQQVTIGQVEQNQAVKLVKYNNNWPSIFQTEKEKIQQALGSTALKIEHIGSTAVTGLMSKPIIDILLVVPHPSAEASYALQLQQAGYILRIREPEFQEHRMFLGIDPDVHLHVYGPDSQEAKDLILFRD